MFIVIQTNVVNNLSEILFNDMFIENCMKFINRLSDLLFVLGRVLNKRKGKKDIVWKAEKDKL